MDEPKMSEDKLHRWTSASAEQVGVLAGAQALADATYARSTVEVNGGDERMATVLEAQLTYSVIGKASFARKEPAVYYNLFYTVCTWALLF